MSVKAGIAFVLRMALLAMLSMVAVASEYVTYLHADVLGSPIMATDEQGQVVWQEEYEPWGARQVKDPAAATASRGSEVWFTGKEEEASLGMYYYGARWYSPSAGAFAAIDPAAVSLENPRSFNRYVYANNNPLRYTDPDGRSPFEIPFFVYDVGKLIRSIYKGEAVGTAAADAAISGLGLISPVPGAGHIIKGARTADRAADVLKVADDASSVPGKAKTLGANPFKGKTAEEASEMLTRKGYVPKGPDPAAGRGTYVNPKTGRGYHIDANHPDPKGPHVGVHRPRDMRDTLEARDYPMGGE